MPNMSMQKTPMPAQAAVRARLIDTTNNRAYDLASARLLIGRESKNDIAVHDVNASRTHAELRFEPQGVWTITDLGSTLKPEDGRSASVSFSTVLPLTSAVHWY